MDQKNRLLREAFEMLVGLVEGTIRPLASEAENKKVRALKIRIGQNLKIIPAIKA